MKVKSKNSPPIVFTNLSFYYNKHVNHYASTFSDIFVTEKKYFCELYYLQTYYLEKNYICNKKNLKVSLKPIIFTYLLVIQVQNGNGLLNG